MNCLGLNYVILFQIIIIITQVKANSEYDDESSYNDTNNNYEILDITNNYEEVLERGNDNIILLIKNKPNLRRQQTSYRPPPNLRTQQNYQPYPRNQPHYSYYPRDSAPPIHITLINNPAAGQFDQHFNNNNNNNANLPEEDLIEKLNLILLFERLNLEIGKLKKMSSNILSSSSSSSSSLGSRIGEENNDQTTVYSPVPPLIHSSSGESDDTENTEMKDATVIGDKTLPNALRSLVG